MRVVMILLLLLVSYMTEAALYDQREYQELQRYRLRTKIIHERLLDEKCVDSSLPQKRQLESKTVTKMLEVEKKLYDQLLDVLISCEKAKLTTARPATTAVTVTCLDSYVLNPVSNTCIRLVQKNSTYAEAKADCETAGEHLAVFPTLESVQWLNVFMNDPDSPTGWYRHFIWIGLHLDLKQGWRWDGRITDSLSSTDPVWAQYQPSQKVGTPGPWGEACGVIRSELTGVADWNSCGSREKMSFVCEMSALTNGTVQSTTASPVTTTQSLTPTMNITSSNITSSNTTSSNTTVSTCSGDYILNPVSNTCIRLVQKNSTYAEAKADCETAGEHLAVFPTLKSVQWLLKFMNDRDSPSEWYGRNVWLGLSLDLKQGWRWDGRITSAVSTTDPIWAQYQPTQKPGTPGPNGEACGIIRSDYGGIRDNNTCTKERFSFICEKI